MSSKPHKIKVAFSVTNCICNDQRVLRIAETIGKLNCEVTIIGRRSGECCKSDTVPFKTKRFRMIFKRGFLFYKCFNIRLLFYLFLNKFDILVSNDLDTLLPNFIVSRVKRLTLVYDSHEYYTGVPEIQDRPLVKWVWKTIEKQILPHLKNVLTVSDSIALQYEAEYGVKPLTIRNCSRESVDIMPFSRKELGLNEDHLLLILQGTGINVDRGGKELIDAIGGVDNVSLLIVGSGNMIPDLKEKVAKMDLSQRVKFYPKLPWKLMMRYTKTADAGVSLDKDTNINHRFSLPNKIFDYISAGLPVIAGDLPEVSKIVSENKCGLIISKISPGEIIIAIKELKENQNLLSELKKNTIIASKSINWQIESLKVDDFYHKILGETDNQ